MVTTSKTLRDRPALIETGMQRADGSWIGGSYLSRQNDKVVASAEFQRRRPPCLTTTPFRVVETLDNQVQYKRWDTVWNRYYVGPAGYAYPGTPINVPFDSGTAALTKARHKASGSEFNFGETLVEFGETVEMIAKTITLLARGFSALKAGKFGAANSSLGHRITPKQQRKLAAMPPSKRLAKGYLEYQFGWSPLVQDVYNAYQALGSRLSEGDRVTKHSGNKNQSADFSKSESRATVSGVVSNQRLANLNDLGLINPALMAWNKVPFSFLVDWFIPISSMLGAMTAGAGLSCYSESLTRYTGFVQLKPNGVITTQYRVGVRTSGLLISSFYFGKGGMLTVGKIASATALLRALT